MLIAMYGMVEVVGEAAFEVFYNAEDLEKKISPVLGILSSGGPISKRFRQVFLHLAKRKTIKRLFLVPLQ